MIGVLLVIIIVLWLAGFIQLSFLSSILFSIANHPFTLHSLLLLIVIAVIIGFLPGIFRTIVSILLILWLLSVFGVLAVTGLPQILIVVLIIAVVFSFF